MEKKFLVAIIVGTFLAAGLASADISYCCERLEAGSWCVDAPQDACDDNYRVTPTSCESTSYCKTGTCIDSEEGTCMEGTPQMKCEDPNGDGDKSDGGVWYDASADDVPQCKLGCCLIGDQAAFVTGTRCKRLSAIYGIGINFRSDISSEIQCIASATSEERGACVFEREYERTCLMTTQRECSEMSVGNMSTEFYTGQLCSDADLNTNCGKSKKTTCVEGKDEVYFVDTCGNVANVYDASKVEDEDYWKEIKEVSESCSYGSQNANSKTCGNCDYYLGSTCKSYERSEDKAKPVYGDYICRDLGCEWEGQEYKHGETWCANQEGSEENLPGSRYFRLVCYNGEVSVEPCADFRDEICIESDIEGFRTAACRVNQWQDCTEQSTKKDCENEDRRDCKWVGDGCVPKFAPGFNFWEDGDADEICSEATTTCQVVYEKKLFGGRECVKNCECLEEGWQEERSEMCIALGDCGSTTNYIGKEGYYDSEAVYSGSGEE